MSNNREKRRKTFAEKLSENNKVLTENDVIDLYLTKVIEDKVIIDPRSGIKKNISGTRNLKRQKLKQDEHYMLEEFYIFTMVENIWTFNKYLNSVNISLHVIYIGINE